MVKFFVGIDILLVESDDFFVRWRKLLPTKIITDKVFTDKENLPDPSFS